MPRRGDGSDTYFSFAEQALSKGPDDPEILNNMASIYEMKGDKERAMYYFEKEKQALSKD